MYDEEQIHSENGGVSVVSIVCDYPLFSEWSIL